MMSGWDDVASSDWEEREGEGEGAFLSSHFQCPLIPPYPTRIWGSAFNCPPIFPSLPHLTSVRPDSR